MTVSEFLVQVKLSHHIDFVSNGTDTCTDMAIYTVSQKNVPTLKHYSSQL